MSRLCLPHDQDHWELVQSDLESERCFHCGQVWHKIQVKDGVCPQCLQKELPGRDVMGKEASIVEAFRAMCEDEMEPCIHCGFPIHEVLYPEGVCPSCQEKGLLGRTGLAEKIRDFGERARVERVAQLRVVACFHCQKVGYVDQYREGVCPTCQEKGLLSREQTKKKLEIFVARSPLFLWAVSGAHLCPNCDDDCDTCILENELERRRVAIGFHFDVLSWGEGKTEPCLHCGKVWYAITHIDGSCKTCHDAEVAEQEWLCLEQERLERSERIIFNLKLVSFEAVLLGLAIFQSLLS
ncbi:MAG: hypothetical protein UT02_C0005G0021 [Parcubacteria group bacterium GW2011_GWC2_38_7]|nr:MAG: hypothetical protein UT02_C0005G0021 [Parcubacteria group bacterium GW2011_GWC2_38_7]